MDGRIFLPFSFYFPKVLREEGDELRDGEGCNGINGKQARQLLDSRWRPCDAVLSVSASQYSLLVLEGRK